MTIEEEIFKKRVIQFDLLLVYGFKKMKEKYIFSKNILHDSFRIDIIISSDSLVKGKIYDLTFNEEYINYRIESQQGEFVNRIRDEFKMILVDIRDYCSVANYFISDQANRITQCIIEKYHDMPEFSWDKYPGYGVFKNPSKGKWYAIIMNVNRSKIGEGDLEVEILNVKLNPDKINYLLTKKGFYQAYHMNKKNWISILLDDTVGDDEVINYIEESYGYTIK